MSLLLHNADDTEYCFSCSHFHIRIFYWQKSVLLTNGDINKPIDCDRLYLQIKNAWCKKVFLIFLLVNYRHYCRLWMLSVVYSHFSIKVNSNIRTWRDRGIGIAHILGIIPITSYFPNSKKTKACITIS